MAKMASLHAQLMELPEGSTWTWIDDTLKVYDTDPIDYDFVDSETTICVWCGDSKEVCRDAQECPDWRN